MAFKIDQEDFDVQSYIEPLKEADRVGIEMYITASELTESRNFNAREFEPMRAVAIMYLAVSEMQPILDGLKKGLYYGPEKVDKYLKMTDHEIVEKTISRLLAGAEDGVVDETSAINFTDSSDDNRRLLHAALGIITEGFELLEEVFSAIIESREVDWINVMEEGLQDTPWYQSIIYRLARENHRLNKESCGYEYPTQERMLATNLRKLLGIRYPDGYFDADAQENRDITSERKTLEGT